jgi:hypothetical protein
LRRSGIKIGSKTTAKTRKVVGNAYELHCGCTVGDEDKVWAPRICCSSCSRSLAGDRQRSEVYVYLKQKFLNINEVMVKEGIFLGAQIKQKFEVHDFNAEFSATERKAWAEIGKPE